MDSHAPNDIGLIKLKKPLALIGHVAAIRLPTQGSHHLGNGTYSDWGDTRAGLEDAERSVYLQAMTAPIIGSDICNLVLNFIMSQVLGYRVDWQFVDNSTLCTSSTKQHASACNVSMTT